MFLRAGKSSPVEAPREGEGLRAEMALVLLLHLRVVEPRFAVDHLEVAIGKHAFTKTG